MRCFRWLKYVFRNYTLFHALGVPVRMNGTYFIFPAAFYAVGGWVLAGWRGALGALGLLAVLLPCLLFHEFAHVVAAARFGVPTRSVVILPIGCVALLEEPVHGPPEILVAAAGPAASLFLGAIGLGLANGCGSDWEMDRVSVALFWELFTLFNLGLGFFNLLPCFPMDGGRVLRGTMATGIWMFWRSRASRALLIATRIAVRGFGWPMAAGMIYVTIRYTHFWHHIVLFLLIQLLGELEYLVLKEMPPHGRSAPQLTFLPVISRPRRPAQKWLRLPPRRNWIVCQCPGSEA